MKLILHIGSAKTGTSALQNALSGNARALREAGYLYPKLGSVNHHLRLLAAVSHDNLPKVFLSKGPVDVDALKSRGEAAFGDVRRQVDKAKPHTIILSSEYFFRILPPQAMERLSQHLHDLADEVEVVAYLRDPVALFLAKLGQRLKTRAELPKVIKVDGYGGVLKAYRRHFALSAYEFGRSANGPFNIVTDFSDRYLQGADLTVTSATANITPSAEGLKLLWQYHQGLANHEARGSTPEAKALYYRVLAAEDALGLPRKLRATPQIAGYIYDAFQPKSAFLKKSYGIDLMANRSPAPDNALPTVAAGAVPSLETLEDILMISQERFAALRQEVARDWTGLPLS